jgi:hypothetical protein
MGVVTGRAEGCGAGSGMQSELNFIRHRLDESERENP